MQRIKPLLRLLIISIYLLTGVTSAAHVQDTIDFEDLPAFTRVTTQYALQGVSFTPSAFLDSDPLARSGAQVLRSGDPSDEFDSGPLTMVFASLQSEVNLFARTQTDNIQGTLRAFNASGAQIAEDGPKTVATAGYTTVFSISRSSPQISRVELLYSGAAFEAIDDLTFFGQPVPDLPTSPPSILSFDIAPSSEAVFGQGLFTATVAGPQLVSMATLRVQFRRPDGSQAPTEMAIQVQLQIAGETATLSFPMLLFVGEQTVTLSVENAAGLVSENTIDVRYFPQGIRTRIQDEGGFASVGGFRFGGAGGGCVYAVFDQMAVAALGGETVVVEGSLLEKWLLRRDVSGFPRLGCPVESATTLSGGVAYQDFSEGRLYLDGSADFEVPGVFAQVLESHTGEEQEWIPVAEPTASSGAMQTWLFQRFRREDSSTPSVTLEIRGSPPTLLVERGRGGQRGSVLTTAPVWDAYECSDLNGPCNLETLDDPPLDDTGAFCNHETYDWEGVRDALLPGSLEPSSNPPEWAAVDGQYTQTPVLGVAMTSKLTSGDNPFTHSNAEFPDCVPGIAQILDWVVADGEPTFCPVDWGVDVVPVRGYKRVLGANRNTVHIEWDNTLARAFIAFGFDVVPGDLFFASGRWIIDCGHENFKSEIHPPSVFARTRSVILNSGRPAAVTYVWVNGWYSGEPVEVPLYPPPRPTPVATLSILRETGTPIDVNFTDGAGLWMKVLRFDASRREVDVTEPGEMKWETGRDFKGRWTLSWSQ